MLISVFSAKAYVARPDIYLMRRGGTSNEPDLVYLNDGSRN
jgi:hypothetical protein